MSKSKYIIKSSDETLRYTLGIVYAPDDVDLQSDFTDENELRKAAWNYMKQLQAEDDVTKIAKDLLKSVIEVTDQGNEIQLDITNLSDIEISKRLGDMHNQWNSALGDIVESYLAPCDFTLGEEFVKRGTWLMGVVWSEEMFEKVLSGDRTGYSMGGTAQSIPV